MGTLIEPNARSAPTPACAATVSIERFRFRGGVSFGSDDVRDVALPAFRRLLLLPREVGERPAVEHRLDRLGSLPAPPPPPPGRGGGGSGGGGRGRGPGRGGPPRGPPPAPVFFPGPAPVCPGR